MNYEIDLSYTFPVLPGNPGDEVFNLLVDGPEGKAIVELPKLQFQKQPGYLQPDELQCRVKSFDSDGLPVLTHIIAPYIYQLYEKTFAKGETFECEVIYAPAKPAEEPYMLRDRNGIFFRHNEPEGLLAKGQIVRCKFTRLSQRFFQMVRVDEGAKLPFHSPETLFEYIDTPAVLRSFITKNVFVSDSMAGIRAEIRAKNPMWMMSCARVVLDHLPEWFLSANLRRHNKLCRALLFTVRDALLYLLEGSGYLNAVHIEQRRALRQQLTEMVEGLEPYADTLRLIAQGREDGFVESLLDKLQKSGYLYHPAQQFAVLMLIFRLHPDKVANYLSRIFESIFGRDLENWKREPFRSAFVEQFEIYVSQARREIDALPLAETRDQKSRLETVITAIALQLLLADEKANISRSSSLFFRYVALLRPLNTEALLTKSFLALMGADVKSRLSYRQLKEPMMMMTQATITSSSDVLSLLGTKHRYTNGHADITVSSDGILLSLTKRRDITDKVVPEGLMTWLKPQIYLGGIKGLSGPRLRKLADHSQWWHDIENSFFEEAAKAAQATEMSPERETRRAEIGDEVYIVIDGVDDFYSSNPTFRCKISDSEFVDGVGILKRDQIVGYNLKQPAEAAYRKSDGTQLGFLATVSDIRSDGSYIFSLRDEIDRFIDEYFNYEDEYVAIVAGINERDYSSITKAGVGIFLEKDNNASYQVGDIVHCRMSQIGKQGQIRAYIVRKSDLPEDHFYKSDAFIDLMHSIGEYDNAGVEAGEEELMRDMDEILSTAEVRELIEIIRFRAIAESDMIQAYDYLRFARMLAIIIADQPLASKLGTHAALLTLHQYYATNSRIDAEKLEALQADANSDPLLRMIYHRLEMVSWLDRSDRVPELYASATDPSNELEGTIARMVLSYNMLRSTDSADGTAIASEIKQQIMKKLNVNNETRRGKYYGSESKYLEFKTSIVYPATAPGVEMREDPDAQQFHILSRIAGMLNANGGRLYIGVNNDGYEVGLHDDFKYFERKTAAIGRYTFKIKSLDNMCVFLENLINDTFGESVARKIEVSVDDEAEKGVILIDIAESLDPVFLQDRLFVRQSGQSTREYHGTAVNEFILEREELKAERNHLLSIDRSPATAEDIDQSETPDETLQPVADEISGNEEMPSLLNEEMRDIVPTSQWRPNVLHNYESGFADPLGYLYLMKDNQLLFSVNDLYMEPGENNCRQALVIPHEMADANLILAFDNERILRIPLAEIFEKGENTPMEHNGEYNLMFAALASKEDAVVCIGTDSADSLWKRAVRVSQIDGAHLMSSPRRLHDAPIHHTFAYEIADAASLERFSDCMADKLAGRRFGVTMRVKESSPNLQYKIEQLVKECSPNTI